MSIRKHWPQLVRGLLQDLGQIGHLDGAEAAGRAVAIAGDEEPVVAGVGRLDYRVRSQIGEPQPGESIERNREQAEALVSGILAEQRRDAVQLRADETRAAEERIDAETRYAGRIEDLVSSLRIGIERDIRDVTTGEKGRQVEEIDRRADILFDQSLARLAELRPDDSQLNERDRKEHADSAARTHREDAAFGDGFRSEERRVGKECR